MVYRTSPFSMTLKDPQTQISRSDNYLTMNISQMAKDTANRKPHPTCQMVLFSMTLSDLWPTFQGHDNIQRQITRLIVSCVWSIQWFRFQWRWVTLDVLCAQLTSDLFAIAKLFSSDEGGPIWIKFRRLVHNDMSTAVMVEIETRCRIPVWRTFWRIQWHVIPEPPVIFQGAATWRIQCHDPRATCHIAGCCNRANSTVCHPRATYHIAGCCHLVNSLSWFQSYMPHCRLQSPGEINVIIVPHCRV